MRAVFLGFLLIVLRYGLCKDACTFDGDIRNFVVGKDKLFVLTDNRLQQMRHDLIEETRKDNYYNATHSSMVNILVPFDDNNTLITCGTYSCGYCEILNLNNISAKSLHWETILVGPLNDSYSVSLLIDISDTTDTKKGKYLLVGRLKEKNEKCGSDETIVKLRNTLEGQLGGIFAFVSSTDTYIDTSRDKIQWVDGFQLVSHSHTYLFLNVMMTKWKVQLLWLENKGSKSDIFRSLSGAILECCKDKSRTKLLSSALIPGDTPVLWAGVFSAQNTDQPENTALAIYDISRDPTANVMDFCNHMRKCDNEAEDQAKRLKPLAVVFKYSSMTSVAAMRNHSWIVLFIGTEDGQLIKLVLDKSLKPACPKVLYGSDDDRRVFPKMLFDPVDHSHIYIALKNEMRRVPVAQCGMYSTLRDCWSALDPFCGWCVSNSRCTFHGECSKSTLISMSADAIQTNLIHFQMANSHSGEITLKLSLSVESTGSPAFSCAFTTGSVGLCDRSGLDPVFPSCSCSFSSDRIPAAGLSVTAKISIENQDITEKLMLKNCSKISGTPTSILCSECISAGCTWSLSAHRCSWTSESTSLPQTTQDDCTKYPSGLNYTEPKIVSVKPNVSSVHGRNNALLTGKNLESVTKIRIQANMDCNPKESPVLERSSDSLTFHIPSGTKGTVRVCAVTPDGRCHDSATISYRSQPTCTGLKPSSTWASGKRRIVVQGRDLELVEAIVLGHTNEEITANFSSGNLLYYYTPRWEGDETVRVTTVSLRVGNVTLACRGDQLTYHPDPQFTSFTTTRTGNDMLVTVQKKADSLNLNLTEVRIVALQGSVQYECVMENIESSTDAASVICDIKDKPDVKINKLRISIGDFQVECKMPENVLYWLYILLLVIPIGIGVALFIYRKTQNTMTKQMNDRLELLECDIRNEIRQGFVDLQTENSDLIENVAAIPFLDYKHFASRTFFPESGPLMNSIVQDIGQDAVKVEPDASCQALSGLIRDQLFLTSFVHALEEQKNFTVKDKCTVASLLTIALHGDLPYLTEVMEELLRALMDQSSNAQPKLMLRRTESIVEKLLTNWMSICLYGFLRESVGQPLFLLVCALAQQISKGPVDSVTEKALYTLNEDWLLWQAQDFSSLKLKALFAVGTEGEVSEPLEVSALTCDTVEQVKEKILHTFQRKFGFPYTQQIRDIDIEFETAGSYVALQEVDGSSEVLGEVTMLNTLRHYKVPDGASIKVKTKKVHAPLSPQTSVKDDKNFSTNYFHLIDPDIDLHQKTGPDRRKLKLKEVYLTKLLSTKVAVHSFVENLFKSIWGMPNNRAPHAVKYFFDFLDAQAESKKITDPDVLHIWKTNSLPLRYWVNILKNPQFVFCDLEKTPHLDGCLSVIAQAFMDSFSLAEQQLGKHAPTNKLLYAKDIPHYKQEVKAYYKQVRDQPAISSTEFKAFLQEESKKHENEFNESAALREIYKYMQRYFGEIQQKLEQNGAPSGLKEELQQVKELFDSVKNF